MRATDRGQSGTTHSNPSMWFNCCSLCLIVNKLLYRCMFWAGSLKHGCVVVLLSEPCPSTCSVCVRWVPVRGLSLEDGSGQSTATGIKHRGRDYFKCQHNVMSCVRRSNVQTVLSGEQLIDQVQFVLLWLLWWIDYHAKTSYFGTYFGPFSKCFFLYHLGIWFFVCFSN